MSPGSVTGWLTPAVLVGLVTGAVYLLSPLTVICVIGFALVVRWARAGAEGTERQLLTALLVAAIALRLAAIAGLFLSTDHTSVPFGTFFGDEDYFIRRSIWLRNLALDIPISLADIRYAYDDSIQTSFVWMLAAVQVLIGPAPYGVHLLSALAYVAGALALYLTVRPAFGLPASLIGLALLLLLPSLFMWSISVLKEPVFFAIMAGVVWLTMWAARRRSWLAASYAAAILLLLSLAAETIRDGGLVVAGAGTVGGILLGLVWMRRRLALVLAVLAVILGTILLSRGSLQDRVDVVVARAALRHWDHVHAPGHSYMIFEPAFYVNRPEPGSLTAGDAALLVLGGLAAYVIVPAPWQMSSRAELAYLPEQIIWYGLVMVAPFGLWAAFRRDPLLTAILLKAVLWRAGR